MDNACFLYLLIVNINYTILSFIESWTHAVVARIVEVVVVDVAVRIHIPNIVGVVRIRRAQPEIASPLEALERCLALPNFFFFSSYSYGHSPFRFTPWKMPTLQEPFLPETCS